MWGHRQPRKALRGQSTVQSGLKKCCHICNGKYCKRSCEYIASWNTVCPIINPKKSPSFNPKIHYTKRAAAPFRAVQTLPAHRPDCLSFCFPQLPLTLFSCRFVGTFVGMWRRRCLCRPPYWLEKCFCWCHSRHRHCGLRVLVLSCRLGVHRWCFCLVIWCRHCCGYW
jgi:hypothetical protein